ncbi:MAG: Arc family DNA binding domain-containing protein [Ardenticatenales bacterium]|jgi:hypothetical protein|nr:Arc family DNA binding domain-containing protein [Ardenticatenales bacterium]
MAERKTFPLRMDPALFAALQRWADDELRSLNGQIEYVLRDALRRSSRLVPRDPPADGEGVAAEP